MSIERPPGTIQNANCGAQVETARGTATCTDHGLGHYDPAMDLSWPAGDGQLVGTWRTPVPPECDPERVETVARALWEHDQPGATPWAELFPTSPSRDRYRRRAAAAIAADPSPVVEAWEEGFAAASEWIATNPGPKGGHTDPPLNPYAALASPAPAPQFWRCARCHRAPEQHAGGREADDCVYVPELASGPAPAPQGEEGQR